MLGKAPGLGTLVNITSGQEETIFIMGNKKWYVLGRAPGLRILVKMALGQQETIFHLEKHKIVGFGQGARIGNFGEDGVRATGNICYLENKKCTFWAGRPDWELW